MENILDIKNLTKKYGRITAVNNLSLKVNNGEVFGILGPNGSGKTTTLAIILGILKNYNGSFSWFQKPNSHKNRKEIGAILETPNFFPYLSAYKNLDIVCEIKGVKKSRTLEVLKTVNLLDRKNDKFSTYSLGMKQRLALASALLPNPKVLVLDEPTNGLDPQGIAEIREIILDMAKSGRTIIIASHILDEIEKICSHVAIIKNGNLLKSGSIDSILSKENSIEVFSEEPKRLIEILKNYSGINEISEKENKILVSVEDSIKPSEINKYLFENNIALSHLLERKKNLETIYLELTA